MNPKVFFGELKRRNVLKVAAAYAVTAWLLIELVSIWLSTISGPTAIRTAFVVIIVLGFAVTMYISWAFEATPGGLKRTAKISPEEIKVLPSWSRRKFMAFIIGVALLAAGLLAFDLLRSQPRSAPSPPSAAGSP